MVHGAASSGGILELPVDVELERTMSALPEVGLPDAAAIAAGRATACTGPPRSAAACTASGR